MKEKITKQVVDRLIKQAATEGRQVRCYDPSLTGFGFTATSSGAVSYFVEYRMGGRGTPTKRMVLGKHGALTPQGARDLAQTKLSEVAQGKDVAQIKQDERKKLVANTFKEASERFLSDPDNDHKNRYWAETRRLIEQNAYPLLGKRPITSITDSQIQELIDDVKARSQSTGRLLFSALNPFFRWAVERKLIKESPMKDLRAPKSPKARDRVLTDDEIKAFWQAASELSWPFENVFKLLLLTAQRREEVAGMKWREFDLDRGDWTIAKERCKNGKAHALDLCPEAIKLLDPIGQQVALRLAERTDDLVFSTTGTTPVSGFSKAKARIDTRMKQILGDRFEPWRTHDLRRTAASGMAGLGFQPHVIERVLNHVSGAQGGLVGVYQRHEYREDRKRALLAWGAHVAELVCEKEAASNVVPLRAIAFSPING